MSDLSEFDLDLPFKGARNYLHSTTAYRAIIDRLGAGSVSDPRLMFKGVARTGLRAVLEDPDKQAKATFTCQRGGEKLRLSLIETGAEVSGHETCFEDAIGEAASLDESENSIVLEATAVPDVELIDIVVAMNKTLHQALFRDHPGKWLFTEVRTPEPLVKRSWSTVRITLKKQLGTHLTRSAIEIDGEGAGYICFSLQEPAAAAS